MKSQIPRLVQLLRQNAERPRDYRISNASTDEATIYIYDVIGMDFWTGEGITAQQFAKDLDSIKASTINLRINSPGGDAFEARAMVTAMARHPATFNAYIDSVAASAATGIAANCAKVEMAPGSLYMIHNAWTFAMGDKRDMTSTANLLAQIDGFIAKDYANKSGAAIDQITAWMDAETWFDPEQAVSAGFADAIGTGAPKNCAKWNLSAYNNAPKQADPQPDDIDVTALRAMNERRLALAERTR